MSTSTATRDLAPHDPETELRTRYPTWTLDVAPLGAGEWVRFNPYTQQAVVGLEPLARDASLVWAHVLALLDAGKVAPGTRTITPDDDAEAGGIARLRLDRPLSWGPREAQELPEVIA